MRIQQIDKKVVYPELSYKLYGLFFSIHKNLGRYCSEKQYTDAFEEHLKANAMGYLREKPIPTSFKGEKERRNIPDFIVEDKIIIDFKSKDYITKDDYFQIRRYLKAYNKRLGIIVNFRQKHLYPKRVLNANTETSNS